MRQTNNLHVVDTERLITPDELKAELPITESAAEQVSAAREAIHNVISGRDPRLLVIAGPCSIHDPAAARDFAERLAAEKERYGDALLLCMRVYFEKPRTNLGWKGLINDPHLDGTHDMPAGLRLARSLLLDLAERGVPAASELLDPITPQYIADLLTWAAVGARTTESQTHREMASGLSMPVGFKNTTEGGLEVAVNAMITSARPHSFLGIDGQGRVSMIRTGGNPACHLVLRGGSLGPNYDRAAITSSVEALRAAEVCPRVLVDCSHGNSGKDHRRQAAVASDIATQIATGQSDVLGVMIEAHLVGGRQDHQPGRPLAYGQSITDACAAFSDLQAMLAELAQAQRTAQSAART